MLRLVPEKTDIKFLSIAQDRVCFLNAFDCWFDRALPGAWP